MDGKGDERTGGDIPPCLIFIDKEGRMFHEGAEMIHKGINSLLLENLDVDAEGRYLIEFRNQTCWVEVEDTPLVVRGVEHHPGPPDEFELELSDETSEPLNPELLWISQDNVIYTRVRRGRLPARFTRPAYYQLAFRLEETREGFGLFAGGKIHRLVPGRPGPVRDETGD